MRDGRQVRSVDDFLLRAEVTDRYAQYDVSAAKGRLLRRHSARRAVARHPAGIRYGTTAPAPAGGGAPQEGQWPDPWAGRPVDEERARLDLDAICTLSVGEDAGDHLGRLIEAGPVDEESPFVFACLLHLLGHADGGRFWWQLTAGADDGRAAYCLVLDHAREGEYHDAAWWAGHPALAGFRPGDAWGDRAAVPEALPLAGGLLGEVSEHEHEVLGRVPVPGPGLPTALRLARRDRQDPPS
ncbi:hypothetical protein [Streptomyces sp. NPDC051109]|uniref:hypothetical protein n=1 Tax=Streptomyces sp. NPDC051109 TaxID=3365642 RepID=UPI0037888AB1